MEIVYCSICGKMVPPGGADDGRHYVRNGEPVCPRCYRQLPPEEHSGTTVTASEPVRGRSLLTPASGVRTGRPSGLPGRDTPVTTPILPVDRPGPERQVPPAAPDSAGGRRTSGPLPASGRRSAALVAGAAVAAGLLLVGAAVGLLRARSGGAPEPAATAPARPGPEGPAGPPSGSGAAPVPAESGLVLLLSHTGQGKFVLAPAGSPDCMRKGALVERDKKAVFLEIPPELEGQPRTFGPWYGPGPKDQLFRITVLRPCTVYALGGSRAGNAELKAAGWQLLPEPAVCGDPASGKRDKLQVWRRDVAPGELRLARDKHNFMLNFVFVPRK
ncbi:MAG TPA: hypothetical protein PK280_06810 [Planctomycetota bacterium]|nr:hypothetical protein [Planctomycetota bacterium]